jgi:hypothetical protein
MQTQWICSEANTEPEVSGIHRIVAGQAKAEPARLGQLLRSAHLVTIEQKGRIA